MNFISFCFLNTNKLIIFFVYFLHSTKEIKKEFQTNAKEAIEYEDKYGFIVENDTLVNDICLNGYSCPDNHYNVIGTN